MQGGIDGKKPWRVADFCWMNFYGAAPLSPSNGESHIMEQRIYVPRSSPVLKISYSAINPKIPCFSNTHNARINISGATRWKLLLCNFNDTGYDSNGYPKTVVKSIDLSAYKGTWQTLHIIVSKYDSLKGIDFSLQKLTFR